MRVEDEYGGRKHESGDPELSGHANGPAATADDSPARAYGSSLPAMRNTGEKPAFTGVLIYKWLLLLTDILCILVATFLATRVIFRLPMSFCLIASLVAFILYPQTFYILDLYNIHRTFQLSLTAARAGLAIAVTAVVAILFFHVIDYGWYENAIMGIQALLVWCFVVGVRWAYRLLFQRTAMRIPVLIIGAGCCGTALYEILKSPLSPYEIIGFLDDDPMLLGKSI